jgi:hypothetical protein
MERNTNFFCEIYVPLFVVIDVSPSSGLFRKPGLLARANRERRLNFRSSAVLYTQRRRKNDCMVYGLGPTGRNLNYSYFAPSKQILQ